MFPYKSKNECYICYEKNSGKTLHAFRKKNRLPSKRSNYSSSRSKPRTTNTGRVDSNFRPEIDKNELIRYLTQMYIYGHPAKIYYKDDTDYRVIYGFRFDGTYIYAPSSKGYDYKYLLGRVRNVQY